MTEEDEDRKQETGDGGQDTEESPLSSFSQRAQDPNLTRAQMEAIIAEQDAVYKAKLAELERLTQENRELENRLSLGTGPLVSETSPRSSPAATPLPAPGEGLVRSLRRANEFEERRDFLRGGPPRPRSVR
jgi:hypothetical protein